MISVVIITYTGDTCDNYKWNHEIMKTRNCTRLSEENMYGYAAFTKKVHSDPDKCFSSKQDNALPYQ